MQANLCYWRIIIMNNEEYKGALCSRCKRNPVPKEGLLCSKCEAQRNRNIGKGVKCIGSTIGLGTLFYGIYKLFSRKNKKKK